jgi:hypothetical protein
MNRTMTYFDLLDAFGEDGCPDCRLALAAIDHYIDSVNYEFVNDSGFRDEVRAANGFCTEHAHQWLKGANVLGTAIIYTDVLVHLTEELRRIHHPKPTFLRGMVSLLNHRGEQGGEPDDPCDSLVPDGGCPACRVRAEQELRAIATLLEVVGEADFREAYAKSAGLCLPHLRRALCAAPDEDAFAAVRDVAIAGEERLVQQLREIIRKHDYRFRDEPSGPERGAAERAVQHAAGARGLGGVPCR